MANPNTNGSKADAKIPMEFEFTSLMQGGKSEGRGNEVVFSSLANESKEGKATNILLHKKGIDVRFPRTDGSITEGKLIEWDITDDFLVIAKDPKDGTYFQKRVKADILYGLNPNLKRTIDFLDVTIEARQNLTSLLDYSDIKTVLGREINNGGRAEALEQAMHTFELPGGIEGVAATSKAGYMYEKGKDGQPKNRNEDVWLIDTQTGRVGVFDGMGGGTNGMRAVETAATIVAENQNDIPAASKKAQEILKADPNIGKTDGACFLTLRPVVGQAPDVHQCGDVDFYHFGSKGQLKYRPGQYIEMGKAAQSAFEAFDQMINLGLPEKQVRGFVGGMAKTAKPKKNEADEAALETIINRILTKQQPVVERNNPLFAPFRRMAVQALTQKDSDVINYQGTSPVEEGDWMVVVSDGVSDNFLPGEMERVINMAITNSETPEWVTKKVSRMIDERIKLRANNDPMALKNHYKLDNATIVIMRVKATE